MIFTERKNKRIITKSYNKKERGFSLLEVMVALSILSLGVTSLLIIRNNSIDQAGKARELRKMKLLLEQKMGEIAVGIEKKKNGVFQEEGYQNYIWYAKNEETKLTSSPDSEGKIYEIILKKVTLFIRYKEAENKFQQSLEAYFFTENPEDAPEESKKQSQNP